MAFVQFEQLSFAYTDAAPILRNVSLHLAEGWTGLVGENGIGKTTFLRLLAREIQPGLGRLHFSPDDATVALCPQRVDEVGPDVALLAARGDAEGFRQRGALRLEPDTLERWATLSPGERKRWQVGAALARRPDVLLLDEPTNHVDAEARALLLSALRRFPGVGIVVSHDRGLLEALTTRTLRVAGGDARLYPCAYSEARALWEGEASEAWAERGAAQEEVRRAELKVAEARRARQAAESAQSGRHRKKHDSDSRSVGAKTVRAWAEDGLGRQVNRFQAAASRARASIPAAPAMVELGRSIFVDFVPAPRRTLLAIDAPGLEVGGRRLLDEVHVRLERGDRVRLAGPNGAGKSTLLRALLAQSTLDPERLLYLPQETPVEGATGLLAAVRDLDREVKGRVLSLVAALGTDPARLLASEQPSPGETRKLQLALGLGRHVWALVLDEPTNHLDLPTVERLEVALSAYPGAVLLVTHDDAFAARCVRATLRIVERRVELAG